jgi:hypothetical protein
VTKIVFTTENLSSLKKPLIDIKNLTNGTVMHIGDMSSSLVHFSNQASSEAHIFIDKFNHKALKILEKPKGAITMHECTGGTLEVGKNDTNHKISIDDNKGTVTLNKNFVIKNNICYYDNGLIDYDAALTKVSKMSLVAAQPSVL